MALGWRVAGGELGSQGGGQAGIWRQPPESLMGARIKWQGFLIQCKVATHNKKHVGFTSDTLK